MENMNGIGGIILNLFRYPLLRSDAKLKSYSISHDSPDSPVSVWAGGISKALSINSAAKSSREPGRQGDATAMPSTAARVLVIPDNVEAPCQVTACKTPALMGTMAKLTQKRMREYNLHIFSDLGCVPLTC